jgi:hypothetical protein
VDVQDFTRVRHRSPSGVEEIFNVDACFTKNSVQRSLSHIPRVVGDRNLSACFVVASDFVTAWPRAVKHKSKDSQPPGYLTILKT